MDLDLRLIEVYTVFNKKITFKQDIDNILLSEYIIVTYSNEGKIHEIHKFDRIARFDTGNIYQQIKYVYKFKENSLPILFPSKDILKSFNEEKSSKIEHMPCKLPDNKQYPHPKMILLDLFNGFKTNKSVDYYYYNKPKV
ncbi:SWPV1-170 [Shearwaterpox virus]|uniref:SWPV1-170 n=1 Tax=Shearwaterpox virus TaxID=1974596 RepID=A0A1V0S7Z0_CNPV|nr:SWPV1-170 [Shearwaterpox virus]